MLTAGTATAIAVASANVGIPNLLIIVPASTKLDARGGPVVYHFVKLGFTSIHETKLILTPADKGHIGGHDGHELHIGVQREI